MKRAIKLPAQLRDKKVGELTKRDLRVVHNSVHLFRLQQTTYAELWQVLGPALKTKQRMGFCAANLSCPNMTDGKRRACDSCRQQMKEAADRRGERPRKLSPYQRWRKAQ